MAIGRPIEQTPNIADKVVTATATAGQTEFTVTGGYRVNHLAVFRNGVRLVNGNDFTALDGATITLMEDASNLDILEFQVFDTFSVSDALLTNAASQTVNGDVTVNGAFTVGSGGIGTFTAATVKVGIVSSSTGITTVQSLQAASSTTTGALQVKGGVGIGKSLYVGGNVSVGGTLTYEDVTNVDSVGLVTAGKGVRITTGGLVVTAGVSTFAGITTVTNTAALHSKQLNVSAGSTFGGAITASDTLSVSGTTTLSGDLSIADKIIHTGDTNTAIRFPSADTITAETGGSERLRITSAGKVGISSASPLGDLDIRNSSKANLIVAKDGLEVKQSSDLSTTYDMIQLGAGGALASYTIATATADTELVHNAYRHSGGNWKYRYQDTACKLLMNTPGGAFVFQSAASGNADADITFSEKLRITSAGRVGINETSPDNMLHVRNDNSAAAKIGGEGGAAYYMEIGQLASSGSPGFNATGSSTSMLFQLNGSEKLRIASNGRVGIASAIPQTALDVYGEVTLPINNTLRWAQGTTTKFDIYSNSDGSLIFRSSGNEKVRIDSSARVLIGTTTEGNASADDLTVATSGTTGITIRSGTSNTGNIYFSDATSGTGEFAGAIEYAHNGNSLRLHTNATEKVRIDTNGNLGIGTISPYALLTVMGPAENGDGTSFGDHGISLHAPGATDEQIIPITGCFETSGLRPRAGIGFISHPTVDPIESYAGEIGFYTRDAADGSGLGSGDERMRLNRAGRLGIGTANPGAVLHTYHATSNTCATFESGDAGAGVNFKDSSTRSSIEQNDTDFIIDADSGATHANSVIKLKVDNSTKVTLDSNGNMLLGKTTGNAGNGGIVGLELHGGSDYTMFTRSGGTTCYLGRNSNHGTILNFLYDGSSVGSVSSNGNSLPSDRNYKKDINDLTLGLDLVNKLKPVSYNYKHSPEGTPLLYGLIAQDLEQSLEEVGVSKNSAAILQYTLEHENDPNLNNNQSKYNLSYEKLIPVLINSVKELSAENNALKARLDAAGI